MIRLSTIFLVFGFLVGAQAEEDALSILNGTSDSAKSEKSILETPATAQQALPESPIRKLFGTSSAEKNIFFDLFEKGDFEKTLFQWHAAFSEEERKTPNAIALFNYLLLKNGLSLTALEGLFKIDKPELISPVIQQLWVSGAPSDHPAWQYLNANWNSSWSQVFGTQLEVAVRGRHLYDKKDLKELESLLQKTSAKSVDRARVAWQIALILALDGKVPDAAKVLRHLVDMKEKTDAFPVPLAEIHMTIARLLYQSGYLDAALTYYEKVPKTSNFWLQTQEEKGWAYLRKGEPQNALALTKTLMSPLVTTQSEPEFYFLHALTELKVCDYPEVLKALENFKSRYKARAQSLVQIAQTGDSPETSAYIERLKGGDVALSEFSSKFSSLPIRASQDHVLSDLVAAWKVYQAESKRAEDLFTRSMSGASSQVGFVGPLDALKALTSTRAQQARSASLMRMKALADSEINDITANLRKMQIVEAEVISQVQLADAVIESTKKMSGTPTEKKGTTVQSTAYSQRYPFEGEHWFDEIGSFKVDIKKGCVAKRGTAQ